MKVLIVGLGSIAKKHIIALKNINNAIEIYALRSHQNAKEIEFVINLFHMKDVLCEKFDFAIISNPTSEHLKTLESLIQLDIPLFIEKPLYHKLELDNILKTVNELGIITYVGCNLRFLGAVQFVKKYINDKKEILNEVNSYCGSYLPEWRKGVDFRKNYSAIPELGGGVHLDLIHELDYIYWFFGVPQKTIRFLSNSSSLNIDAIDYANYLLDYSRFRVNVVLNYYRRDAKRVLELVYQDETIKVDLLKDIVYSSEKGKLFKGKTDVQETYNKQMKYFVDCVLNKRETFNTINDAYKVLKITLNK